MRMKPIGLLLALLLPAFAPPAAAGLEQPDAEAVLGLHNKLRGSLGLAPLRWSAPLAVQAQRWAEHLATLGRMEHSGPGENLAMGTAGAYAPAQLAGLWGQERAMFVNGSFPEVSRTGNWADVGHYSQMVWRRTTMLGCGFARGRGQDFLVCRYGPAGNVSGERPY